MKRIIFIFIYSLSLLTITAQPRVDGKQRFKVLKSSPIVTSIVGWAYDKNREKWAGYYNTIFDYYNGNNKIPKRPSVHLMSIHDNILSLQVKKIEYKNSIYYAIIKTSWGGAYNYPELKLDWFEIKERSIDVYDTVEYKKLSHLTETVSIVKSVYSDFFATTINGTKLNDHLLRIFNGEDFDRFRQTTYFKKEDENTIRFSTRKEDISDKYFEMKKSVFDTLLIK